MQNFVTLFQILGGIQVFFRRKNRVYKITSSLINSALSKKVPE